MSSGIVQLVAKGAQDEYLTANPEVSLFQSNYRRHTNFAMSTSKEIIQGIPSPGNVSTIKVPAKGDLLKNIYITAYELDNVTNKLKSVYPTSEQWIDAIDKVELLIGGQVIDSLTSEYIKLLAPDILAKNFSQSDLASQEINFFPLRFSFFEELSSALPLVAIQYHDIYIRITWGQGVNLFKYDVFMNYINLDMEERNIIAEQPRMMICTQVQKLSPSNKTMCDLNFNHPVKFIAIPNKSLTGPFFNEYNKIKFQINGADIDDYKFVQPHFTSVQSFYYAPFSGGNTNAFLLYSFCQNTHSIQPSGSLNFSRLDSMVLLSDEIIQDNIYAVNYNILKVESGMAGLLFSA